MLAVRFHEFGGPSVLSAEQIDAPEPGEGQARVRVLTAGVQFGDVLRRRGTYPGAGPTPLPFIPGQQVIGEVTEVGAGVDAGWVGQQVMSTLPGGGGYAEEVVVPTTVAARFLALPDGLDPVAAATLQVQGVVAYLTLREVGRLRPGETVLVHAAAGAVGAYAVQLARLLGADRVIATASTPEKLDLARRLGADQTFDVTRDDLVELVLDATDGRGVDVVLDSVGGEVFTASLAALAHRGRLVSFGASSGTPGSINPQVLVPGVQTISGFFITHFFNTRPDLVTGAIDQLAAWVTDGRLDTRDRTVFSMQRAADAHRSLEDRTALGSLVLAT